MGVRALKASLDHAYGAGWADREPTRTLRPVSSPGLVQDARPAQLEGYTRLEVLARSASTVIERAWDVGLGREVLLKRLLRADDTVACARLLREARLMARVAHASVLPVHALITENPDGPVLVTSYPVGMRVWSEVIAAGRQGAREQVEIALAVARTLAHAHAHGVLHLDLKPSRIHLGPFGEVFVLGWGGGCRVEESAVLHPRGTPAYMPPELVRGERPTEASDVYLLAGTLWHALVGAPPHPQARVLDALSAAEGVPRPAAGVPAGLLPLLLAALDPRRERRPPSVDVFAEGLERFLAQQDAERITASVAGALADDADVHALEDGVQELLAVSTLWPAHGGARVRLQEVRERLVRAFLQLRDVRSAERVAAELDGLPVTLRAELERQRRRRREDDELQVRDHLLLGPPEITSSQILAWVAVVVGSLTLLWWVPDARGGASVAFVAVPLAGLIVFSAATGLHRSRANLVGLGVALLGTATMMRLIGMELGVGGDVARLAELILFGTLLTTATAFHAPFLYLGIAAFVCAAIGSVFPEVSGVLFVFVALLVPPVAATPDRYLGPWSKAGRRTSQPPSF